MKRLFMYPLAALAALANTAHANATPAEGEQAKQAPQSDPAQALAQKQLKEALTRALAIYPHEGDNFAFTLEQRPDGTLFAQHRSHYSHSSHSSHSSHRSHYSSR